MMNAEIQMTNYEGSPNDKISKTRQFWLIRHWEFFRHLAFVIRHLK